MGSVFIKSGAVRKALITKPYMCMFVSFAVKAVHLELVAELTTAAFIAVLHRFTARRGKPSVLWSDHRTNFVGAAKEIKELYELLCKVDAQKIVSDFCSGKGITW